MSYRERLHLGTSDPCPLCDISTHTVHHIMEKFPSFDPLRHSHTQSLCTEDLWDHPGSSIAFLRSAGLLDQS